MIGDFLERAAIARGAKVSTPHNGGTAGRVVVYVADWLTLAAYPPFIAPTTRVLDDVADVIDMLSRTRTAVATKGTRIMDELQFHATSLGMAVEGRLRRVTINNPSWLTVTVELPPAPDALAHVERAIDILYEAAVGNPPRPKPAPTKPRPRAPGDVRKLYRMAELEPEIIDEMDAVLASHKIGTLDQLPTDSTAIFGALWRAVGPRLKVITQ